MTNNRSTESKEAGGGFLFVHQTEWQQRLLNIYGQEICLLDATYKTSRFDLPLFFICVNTNVGFSIVASFLISDESADTIREALDIIKGWNPDCKPSFFMCDFDTREISALESLFDGMFVCP